MAANASTAICATGEAPIGPVRANPRAARPSRYRDVPPALARPVRVPGEHDHADSSSEVRERREEPHEELVQIRELLDDRRQPKRDPIEARDGTEVHAAEKPESSVHEGLAQCVRAMRRLELLLAREGVLEPAPLLVGEPPGLGGAIGLVRPAPRARGGSPGNPLR